MKEDKIVSDVFVSYLSKLTDDLTEMKGKLCELPKLHPDRREVFYKCYAMQLMLDAVNARFLEYTNSPIDTSVFD